MITIIVWLIVFALSVPFLLYVGVAYSWNIIGCYFTYMGKVWNYLEKLLGWYEDE